MVIYGRITFWKVLIYRILTKGFCQQLRKYILNNHTSILLETNLLSNRNNSKYHVICMPTYETLYFKNACFYRPCILATLWGSRSPHPFKIEPTLGTVLLLDNLGVFVVKIYVKQITYCGRYFNTKKQIIFSIHVYILNLYIYMYPSFYKVVFYELHT